MRTVYAIQIEIGGDPETTFDGVLDRLGRWVVEKYADRWGKAVEFPRDGGESHPLENHGIRVQCAAAKPGALVSLDWTHPDERDSSLLWATACQLARADGGVQLLLSLRVASAGFEVRPVRFQFGRPAVISEVLRSFPCSVQGTPIRTAPRTLAAEFVDDFVQRELLEKERPLPILMLSSDETGAPPVDPLKVQAWVLGHAHVVVLKDKWAGYKLTNALGKDLSCFHGHGRLYWPGLERGADPIRFPLYDPVTLRDLDRFGRDFPRRLFEQLAAVASFRLVEGAIIRTVREAAESERAAHMEALRRDRESRSDYEELLKLADQEIADLRAANQSLASQLADLKDQLATAQANLAAVWREPGERDLDQDAQPAASREPDAELTSVRDALDWAEQEFGDVLRVYESARQSASASRFARPRDVYRALREIADLGRAYFGSDDRRVGRWEERFSFKYAHTESETTKNMYGASRVFGRGDGEQRQMLRHLTLGGGDKVNCLQIYFEADGEEGTMDIGYCGEHLPYAKQRS